MLAAPGAAQLRVLAPPCVILAGLAANPLIEGTLVPVTVTVSIAVAEPAEFVAVRMYVVVADGLNDADPVAEVDE
jgi:hypothetical protein